jgi:hypothetical protein
MDAAEEERIVKYYADLMDRAILYSSKENPNIEGLKDIVNTIREKTELHTFIPAYFNQRELRSFMYFNALRDFLLDRCKKCMVSEEYEAAFLSRQRYVNWFNIDWKSRIDAFEHNKEFAMVAASIVATAEDVKAVEATVATKGHTSFFKKLFKPASA